MHKWLIANHTRCGTPAQAADRKSHRSMDGVGLVSGLSAPSVAASDQGPHGLSLARAEWGMR